MGGDTSRVGGRNNVDWGNYNVENNPHVDKSSIENEQYDTSILKQYPPDTHNYEAVTLATLPRERKNFFLKLLADMKPPVDENEPIIVITPKTMDLHHLEKMNLVVQWRDGQGQWQSRPFPIEREYFEHIYPEDDSARTFSEQIHKEALIKSSGNKELANHFFLEELLKKANQDRNTVDPELLANERKQYHGVDAAAMIESINKEYGDVRASFKNRLSDCYKNTGLAENASPEEMQEAARFHWESASQTGNAESFQKFCYTQALIAYNAPDFFLDVDKNARKEDVINAFLEGKQNILDLRQETKNIPGAEPFISDYLEGGLYVSAYKMLNPEKS